MLVEPDLSIEFYRNLLKHEEKLTVDDAIFRNEKLFTPANLRDNVDFWEKEILKDHPHKTTILGWIQGVKLEEFLNSFTSSEFQGKRLHSHYPEPIELQNYVPNEFEEFMDNQVQEWLQLGVMKLWEDVRLESEPEIPTVVCPLGVEPKKPRALWDGRYVNEFCRDIPFHMDNAAKVAETAWPHSYFFKLDHKNGYLHIPLHRSCWRFFGVFWKGKYYVITVLPFGWKSSPVIYHTITEALAMYLRSLGIPMLCWIDDMFGSTEQSFKDKEDELQFQSAMRALVVTSYVLFKAGYFVNVPKCCLIPEKVMTYLGIECDSLHCKFLIPQERILKYLPILQDLISKQWVSFADLERIVGKLVSLESAVPAGMWYTREQYAVLRKSGISPSSRKVVKEKKFLKVTPKLREEWSMWIYFLTMNTGAPWKKYQNIYLGADIATDASGRSYAGVIDFPDGPLEVVGGEFEDSLLKEDIQVKEGEALRATLQCLVDKFSSKILGKTLICKIDNQVLKAVLERKGTSQNSSLNEIGKQIYWLQQMGQFYISLQYVRSEDNVADKFTREAPGLEVSLSHHTFMKIWNSWGPFQWDLMATSANVKKDPQGKKLSFFSRYHDSQAAGVDLFAQQLHWLKQVYCFPPIPIVGMVLKYLEQQKVDCVMIIPSINAPWVNLMSSYMTDLMVISLPFDVRTFTVLNPSGKKIPKKFPHAMLAVKLQFSKPGSLLKYLHA